MAEILASEIMAAAGARELRDGEVVVVGLGLPQVACVLAKRTHAPGLSALLEIGVMNMSPIHTAVGLADCRIGACPALWGLLWGPYAPKVAFWRSFVLFSRFCSSRLFSAKSALCQCFGLAVGAVLAQPVSAGIP